MKIASWAGLTLALVATLPASGSASEPGVVTTWRLQARVIAVGLPGVAGVRQVGRFHGGGPIPSNPEFLLSTSAGRVLDPERVLVAVGSNFGAAAGDAAHATGSVLSIHPGGPESATLVVPEDFAASGDQSEALGGAVRLYTGQSRGFANRRHNAGALTAAYAAASGPRYLSVNNAIGRPWIANAPQGRRGAGSVSVVDPDGAPLANAPSGEAGGVFVGDVTNREWTPRAYDSGLIARTLNGFFARPLNYKATGQLTPGALAGGVFGTAFLGPSPDGTGLAVFAAVTGDGAVAQIHVQDGVDGLAPPGTVAPDPAADDGNDPGVIGIAFKWNPERVLYVADAMRDRLVLLHLDDDHRHFRLAHASTIESPAFRRPVDVAAAVPEVANPRFASHTTLAGGSDLYVANRGDGTLARLSQDGRLLARAEIELPGAGVLAPRRVRAMAVSADAQRLWVTLSGELPGFAGRDGALVEVSAFDADGPFARQPSPAVTVAAVADDLSLAGERAFLEEFAPGSGLGPLFNARSCVACHPGPGGNSTSEEHFARRVARMDPGTGRVTPVDHPNSPLARRHSTRELGQGDTPAAVMPRQANVISLRMPLPLHASGRLDEIPDAAIEAEAVSKGDGIKGRVHRVTGGDGEQRVGRYGWKADIATLEEMVAEAFASEIGVSSALAAGAAVGRRSSFEDEGDLARAVAAYLRTLHVPGRAAAP
jgi:hypothetical protein